MMQHIPRVVAVLVALAGLPKLSVADAMMERGNIPESAALIKSAIVAGAALEVLRPELVVDAQASKQLWKISSLVVAFDSMDNPSAVRHLVSLMSYNLGEATNELYMCILVRKGKKKVRALLESLGRTGSNECEATPLSQLAERPPGSPRLCLSTEEMRGHVASVLDQMAKNQGCKLELYSGGR